MDRRMTATIAAAVMGMLCLMPLAADNASAEHLTDRISDKYIAMAEFDIPDGEIWTDDIDAFYMLKGSENHELMETYLKDPRNGPSIDSDDRNILSSHAGEKVCIYGYSDYLSGSITFMGTTLDAKTVLEPYNLENRMTGDPEDVVKINVHSIDYSNGTSTSVYYIVKNGSTWQYSYTDIQVSFAIEKDTAYTIELNSPNNALYATIDYDLTVSKPNGSATAFAAICMVLSAATIALLVFAAIKPRWSR